MSRFSAETLDLSRLPPPNAVKTIDFELIIDERKADLLARFAEAEIEYDVEELETDPAVILQQADAYREVLGLGSVNDAVKAVLPMFATGADLDHIGLKFFGVQRMAGEGDERYRLRILLSPEALPAGSPGGYVFQAMTASLLVKHVGVSSPAPGYAQLVILSSEGDGTASEDLLTTVRARLFRDDIKPLTDVVTVFGAEIVSYRYEAILHIPSGPDPASVVSAAEESVQLMADDHHRVDRSVFETAQIGAAQVGNVRKVVKADPDGDIPISERQAPFLTEIVLSTVLVDD